jgi:hypothetical protein
VHTAAAQEDRDRYLQAQLKETEGRCSTLRKQQEKAAAALATRDATLDAAQRAVAERRESQRAAGQAARDAKQAYDAASAQHSDLMEQCAPRAACRVVPWLLRIVSRSVAVALRTHGAARCRLTRAYRINGCRLLSF